MTYDHGRGNTWSKDKYQTKALRIQTALQLWLLFVIIKNQNDRSRGSIYCRDKQWQMEDQNVALKNEIEICNNKLESVGKKLKYFEELIVDKQNELKGKENVNPSNKNGLDLKFKNCKIVVLKLLVRAN